MGVSYSSYLFDSTGFLECVSPIVPALEAKDYQSLYRLARQTMEPRPDLWELVADLFIGSFEEDTEPPPENMVAMLLAPFLQSIRTFQPNGGYYYLDLALPVIG